jgi:rhodanese-related sulfurtransferase
MKHPGWLEKLCPPCERLRRSRLPVARVRPRQLCRLLREGSEVTLLDVRHPLELLHDARVLPGARRVRPQDLAYGPLHFPLNTALVVYAGHGGEEASEFASRHLIRRGYRDVRVLEGGLPEWERAGLPLAPYDVREADRPGRSRAACRPGSGVFR